MTDDEVFARVDETRRRVEARPLPESVGALIERAAAQHGDRRVCLFFEDGVELTYARLDERSNRLADALMRLGARKGTHVGVMLPNVAEFPITWIAIAKLGAVMVPINIGYTGRELSYVVNDSDAQFLVIDESCVPALDAMPDRPAILSDGHVIVRGAGGGGARRSWQELGESGRPGFRSPQPVTGSDLLNIQYTSGTTGFPKGCMLSHRYWLILGQSVSMSDDPPARNILVAQPFYYMDPQWLLLMAVFAGGAVYVARRASASRFMEWVRTYAIEYCIFPEVVTKQPPSPRDADNALRRVNIFGFSKEAHLAAEQRFHVVAREAFGMTEIGPGLFMPAEATHMVGSGSCGLPGPYRRCKITDEHGQEVPRGEIGELCVTGDSILWGYYKKPAANAAAFRGEWFRTGDLFRQDEPGYFYLVGRLKDMIRRSGENISAREVEAVLRSIPEVAEAAVVPVPDEYRKEEVKAYLVLQPGIRRDALPPEKVIDFCLQRLARFKVPRYIEYIDELPKTPSQKIAKPQLVALKRDLREGSYDRVDGVWR